MRDFSAYINSITRSDSNTKTSIISVTARLTEKRQREIRRWIENEQVLCGLDSNYWESRYAFVCDEKGQIFKFANRRSQEVFDAVIAEFDEKQVSIELLLLKARQLGISTKVALKFIHRLMFIPHTQAIMASVQKKKSELIERILNIAFERCPWWLVPNRNLKRSFDNGSILSIQSGMQATGLAQGWTPTLVHLCLTPNTLVRVADGFLKPIALIEAGDTVITKEGELAKVKGKSISLRRNELSREIWLWGCFAPGSTLDHPVFTRTGWKRADQIKEKDWVRHPVREITRTIERFRGTHLPRSKRKDRGERFWVNLNPEFGYICGLYLAEGSCGGTTRFDTENAKATRLIFSIHQNEIPAVRQRLRAVFGDDQYMGEYIKKNTSSAKLTVDLAHMARWMYQQFGSTDEKRVPDWVWRAGREFCLALIHGYLDGDGHYTPNSNEIQASSVRVQLPIQMRDLIASLGFGWSSIQYKSAGIYYERNCREQWTLLISGECGKAIREAITLPSFPAEPALHWKYDLLKENIDIQVEMVADGFSQEFYDIEVDHPSHSFLTVQCATHNSELADIPNPEVTIEEGLFRATHSSKNLFMVLEGTGGGNTGWLADTWRSSKEDWPKGQARLCPVFIPWAMCPDIYPEPDWLRKFPVPEDWQRRIHETTRKHVIKCESYIRNTPYLARIAGRDWRMPPPQQWFWQFNYDQACKNHTQKIWAAQMPADDFEALTGVADKVFDPEVLMGIEDSIYELQDNQRVRKSPVMAYAITGHDVDEVFYPREERIDNQREFIRVEWESHRGQHYQWTMVPLLPVDEERQENTMDCLLIYEWPKSGNYYSCGIDTADGLGKVDEERSCLSVSKNRFGGQTDQQVAELTSNRINSAQITAFAACVGALYGPACPDSRGLKFAIEQIQGPGDTCQHQLKMMGFFNHHKPRRYDSKKIRDDSTKKEGWYSNVWSVPMLMTKFVDAVNGGWYEPRSKWLIEELRDLERHITGSKSKMEHGDDKFDDRVRAAAQSYFTAHDMDVLTERAQKRYAPPVRKTTYSKEPCRANAVSIGW